MKIKKYSLLIILLFLGNASFAQQSKQIQERHRLISHMQSALIHSAIKDTNEVVMFAYRVHITRQKDGAYKIISSSVSDSIAYSYFKDTDFLKIIDYKLFANNRREATVILPLAILIGHPTKTNPGLISIDSLADRLINYLYLHDEKSVSVDTSNFIYLPTGIMKTSSAIDY